MGAARDFCLGDAGQVVGHHTLSVIRVAGGAHPVAESCSVTDAATSGQARSPADAAVVADLAIVRYLHQGADLAIVADSGLVQSGPIKAGGWANGGSVTDHHASHLGDAHVRLAVEDVTEAPAAHHGLAGDHAILTDLAVVQNHGARADHGAGADFDPGA
jgi:hypothetical protein